MSFLKWGDQKIRPPLLIPYGQRTDLVTHEFEPLVSPLDQSIVTDPRTQFQQPARQFQRGARVGSAVWVGSHGRRRTRHSQVGS